MKTLISGLLLFLSFNSYSYEEKTSCDSFRDFHVEQLGKIQLKVMTLNKKCNFILRYDFVDGPEGTNYRSFIFSDQGDIQIFNNWGRKSGMSGYSLFPRRDKLSLTYDLSLNILNIYSPSGIVFSFDTAQGALLNVSNMDWSEDPEINGKNKGGIELRPLNGFILDEGFRLGAMPRVATNRNSTFIDSDGNQCSIANGKLFDIIYDREKRPDGANLKFKTDQELINFVNTYCKEIITTSNR